MRPIEYSPAEAVRLHDTVIGRGGLIRRRALEASGGWPEVDAVDGATSCFWIDIGLRGRRDPRSMSRWYRGAATPAR